MCSGSLATCYHHRDRHTTEALQHLLLDAAGALIRKYSLLTLVGESIFRVTKFCFLNEKNWKRDTSGTCNITYRHYNNVIFFTSQLDAKSTLHLWDTLSFFLKDIGNHSETQASSKFAASLCSAINRIGLLQYSSLKLIFENAFSFSFSI